MNEFDVITVPSFGDFVAETTITNESIPAARIVLGEKTRQHNGLPIVEVTLDLQGFNDCHELVWLSKSVTIAGVTPGLVVSAPMAGEGNAKRFVWHAPDARPGRWGRRRLTRSAG